jgi:hypothetical protein
MVAPALPNQSMQPCIPSASKSNEACVNLTRRIAAIAIPLIMAYVGSFFLPAAFVIVITAVVTLVSLAYAKQTEIQPSQPSSTIEPSTVAADPSRPQEIMFMSAKRNEKCDINKAEYMTVVFKTNEIAENFMADHSSKFSSSGAIGLDKIPERVNIFPGKDRFVKDSVDILKKIYRHEGDVSLLCSTSFCSSSKISV